MTTLAGQGGADGRRCMFASQNCADAGVVAQVRRGNANDSRRMLAVRHCADAGVVAQVRRGNAVASRHSLAAQALCRVCVVALCLCMVVAVGGCERKERVFQFDSATPLALHPEVEWALVSAPYAACYAEADYASAVATHYRRGAVLQVQGVCSVPQGDKQERWYAFDAGWIPASALEIYANKLRADTAARQLLEQ